MAMLEKATGMDFDGDGTVGARGINSSTSESRVIVSYMHEESLLKNVLRMDDEILEVNGVKVTSPAQASKLMVDAGPTLELVVNRLVVKREMKKKWLAGMEAA